MQTEPLMEQKFKLVSEFDPAGDQPEAITALSQGLREGKPYQTLLGVTGSGKTYTLANVIQEVHTYSFFIFQMVGNITNYAMILPCSFFNLQ